MTGVTIVTSSTVHRDSLELERSPRSHSGHQLRLGLDSHRLSRTHPVISMDSNTSNADHQSDYKDTNFINVEVDEHEKGFHDNKTPSPTLTYTSYAFEGSFPGKA